MLFALIFPRPQRASTYDISAERNVWLQSALRSFAIVCDYMETGFFAIVCDPRSSAIVCEHMETSLKYSLICPFLTYRIPAWGLTYATYLKPVITLQK